MKYIKAFISGVQDGYEQPYELSSSTNVPAECMEWLDTGVNVGQFLRAGFNSQPFTEGK